MRSSYTACFQGSKEVDAGETVYVSVSVCRPEKMLTLLKRLVKEAAIHGPQGRNESKKIQPALEDSMVRKP